jgi:predicted Zn-dependent protease
MIALLRIYMMRLFRIWILLFLIVPFLTRDVTAGDASEIIFSAMEQEMDRSLKTLKIDVFDTPYFIKYQVRQTEHAEVSGSFGALIKSSLTKDRKLFVDVRVGGPDFDSSTPGSHEQPVEQFIPLDDDFDALRRAIWYETDLRYKQGIMNYLKKKGRFISGVEANKLPDFSGRGGPPARRVEPLPEFKIDFPEWEDMARRVSMHFKNAPDIEKSRVKLFADRAIRYYLDSEDSKIRDAVLSYGVILEAWTKTDSGNRIYDQDIMFFSRPERLPSYAELVGRVEKLTAGIEALRRAPRIEPYAGPAIFSPDATALLFHEAIGHRLEGDRLREANDGKTFIQKIGERILPPFITVIDDPRIKTFQGEDLLGYYLFDDEGQEGQKVVLVDQGVLKNFLLSRTPIPGFAQTNGHARSDGTRSPSARMSNFIIRSDNRSTPEQLKRRLLDEVEKQKKPYGLMVKKILNGETQTESRDFQVFKGKPIYLYKVYPDGREELVRGAEFLGTPISMVNKIVLAGDDDRILNAFCGAESGVLPVTSIAPSVLLSEVELQIAHEPVLRRPILPPPQIGDF